MANLDILLSDDTHNSINDAYELEMVFMTNAFGVDEKDNIDIMITGKSRRTGSDISYSLAELRITKHDAIHLKFFLDAFLHESELLKSSNNLAESK